MIEKFRAQTPVFRPERKSQKKSWPSAGGEKRPLKPAIQPIKRRKPQRHTQKRRSQSEFVPTDPWQGTTQRKLE